MKFAEYGICQWMRYGVGTETEKGVVNGVFFFFLKFQPLSLWENMLVSVNTQRI